MDWGVEISGRHEGATEEVRKLSFNEGKGDDYEAFFVIQSFFAVRYKGVSNALRESPKRYQ